MKKLLYFLWISLISSYLLADEELKFSQTDYLEYSIELGKLCLTPETNSGFNFSDFKRTVIAEKCVNTLSQSINPKFSSLDDLNAAFWEEYLSNPELPYFVYNLYKLTRHERTSHPQDLARILILGVLKGDKVNEREVLQNIEDYSERYPELASTGTDLMDQILEPYSETEKNLYRFLQRPMSQQRKDYKKYIDFDISTLTNYKKAEYLNKMLPVLYEEGDTNFYKLEKKAIEYLNLNQSNLLAIDEFRLLVNLMYFNININRKNRSFNISQRFLNSLNLKKKNSPDYLLGDNYKLEILLSRFSDNVEYENEQNDYYVLLTYVLNHHRVYQDLFPSDHETYELERQHLMMYVNEANESGFYGDSRVADWESDTGSYFLEHKKCMAGEKHLEKAFEIYETFQEEDSKFKSDNFEEPLILATCFLKKDNYSKASKYLDLSNKNYVSYFKRDYGYESLEKIVRLYIEGNIREKTQDIQKIVDTLLDQEYLLGFAYGRTIDEFIFLYTQIYNELEEAGEQGSLMHPIELSYLRERIENTKNLQNIKIKGNEKKAKLISDELKQNNRSIIEAELNLYKEEDAETPDKINLLYRERSGLISKLFENKKKLKNLLSPDYKFLEEFRLKLDSNEVILNYNLTTSGSYVWVITKEDYLYFDLDQGTQFIKNKVKVLKKSLEMADGKVMKFDLETSHILYKEIFEKIEKRIGKNLTIYLFGSDLESLPFNSLVSHLSKKKNYVQNLLESRFLIEDYNFVNVFPLSRKKTKSFSNKFIAFANPSNLKELGLTALPSSEDEAIFLAMASGVNNNNFFGKKASKENVFKSLISSYERIHFGTHSLPPYWNSLTSESSLVLDGTEEDYLLTTSEISAMEIRADVIILASCNSSMEGFDSLYKSFLVAGSNSVIYSNWDLETRSSNAFTQEMFKILWENREVPLHEAMRSAILKLKDPSSDRKYISPSYWANFSIAYSSI